MNYMEEFLNFEAVVKLRNDYDNDLFKFVELMKSIGFLKEYAEYFEKSCCYDKKYNEFSEDLFWHYVELNNGDKNNTCLEFQWGKGFTWGNKKDCLDYDNEIKILSVDDLIKACKQEEMFNMNYEYTDFQSELEDKEIALEFDDFLNFYEWSIVKYPDGKYNIIDKQCNTFIFDENTLFDNVVDRVYFRMLDYFINEETTYNDNPKYLKYQYEKYIQIGNKLNLLNEENKSYTECFQDNDDLNNYI